MHPPDFARAEPRTYALPAEWADLESRYEGLGSSEPLEWVYAHVKSLGATAALQEHEYLDRDYRNEYRHFYTQTLRRIPDRCERLHFWREDQYLGYCSIRPIVGRPVCRTLLDPGHDYEDEVGCVVVGSARPYGQRYVVPAFPFISQDRQYGRCAHAVIWMIAHYYHLAYQLPQRFMSDIVDAASALEPERIIPSDGLTDDQVGYAFRKLELPAIRYELDGMPRADLEDLLRRFLNSRFPLALGTKNHLTAVIGAGGEDADGNMAIVQCDDESGAYCRAPVVLDGEGKWEVLFAPLPGRIFVRGEDIVAPMKEKLGELWDRSGWTGGPMAQPLRFREYAVEAPEYKQRLFDRELPGDTAFAHARVASARWLWVTEVQDATLAEQDPHCVLGEIAVDATSDAHDLGFLFGNVPGLRAQWHPGEVEPSFVLQPRGEFSHYLTGTALNV